MHSITWGDVLIAALAVIEARGVDAPALEVETMVQDMTKVRRRMNSARPHLSVVKRSRKG